MAPTWNGFSLLWNGCKHFDEQRLKWEVERAIIIEKKWNILLWRHHNLSLLKWLARFTSFAQFHFECYFWLLSTVFDHLLKFCYYEIEHLSKTPCSNTVWANFVLKWTELSCQNHFRVFCRIILLMVCNFRRCLKLNDIYVHSKNVNNSNWL